MSGGISRPSPLCRAATDIGRGTGRLVDGEGTGGEGFMCACGDNGTVEGKGLTLGASPRVASPDDISGHGGRTGTLSHSYSSCHRDRCPIWSFSRDRPAIWRCRRRRRKRARASTATSGKRRSVRTWLGFILRIVSRNTGGVATRDKHRFGQMGLYWMADAIGRFVLDSKVVCFQSTKISKQSEPLPTYPRAFYPCVRTLCCWYSIGFIHLLWTPP